MHEFLTFDMRDAKSSHLIFLDLITLIILGAFSLLCPSNFLNTLFLNALNRCNSAWVRKQVSDPHKRAGKIILIFALADCRPNGKMFWSEWWQALPELILRLVSS
jgi:hypothetical protein